MKKHLINAAIVVLLFAITAAGLIFAIMIREGDWGIPKGFGILFTFLFLFGITGFGLSKFESRIRFAGVLIPIGLVILILTLPKAYFSTIKYSMKIAPYYLAIIFGVISGYYFFIKDHHKFKVPIILGILPVLMTFGTYDLWVHKIEYGNWTGEVTAQQVAPFELINKAGEVVNNESLKGKVTLFDFWFIGCGPCWVKFPELQRIYEKYQSNSLVEIYAVNRPMKSDKPDALFTRIEDKGYSFPVLAGTQEIMDTLDVYKYPSVMIINQNGDLVFMGELEDAEKKLESMIDDF
ncbi:MAG: TlpA family protein disulfide reductase [Reichenbachiella sp.]